MWKNLHAQNHCLHVTETLGSLKYPNCSAISRVSQPLITSENTVCKLPHHVLSDCGHKYTHEILRTELFAPSLSKPDGLTMQGRQCPVRRHHFIRLLVEEKHVWHVAFETPSLPYLENHTTNQISMTNYMNLGYRAEKIKKGG